MKIRLYLDEDSIDKHLIQSLRARAVDVISALDVGMIERTDTEHLEWATAEGRMVSTFNVGDFCALHNQFLAQNRTHAGIVVSQQQQYSVGEHMRRLLKLISEVPAEAMTNRLEFLSDWA